MKKTTYIPIILFFLFNLKLIAQTEGYSRADRIAYEEADSYIAYGDYFTAFKLFSQLYEKDSLNPWINYKMGYAAFKLNDYDKARPYFERGINVSEDASFYLASILHYQSFIGEAERLVDALDLSKLTVDIKELERLRNQIVFTKKQFKNPEAVSIKNIGEKINSKFPDYVPLITADESQLFFTSRRPSSQEKSLLDATGQYYESVYFSQKVNREWEVASPVKGAINTAKHDACVGLSSDGKRMFLFRTNPNMVGGDLYESIEINGFWSIPLKLSDKINGEFSIEPSASISLNERVLYFSSNREGGYGGFDLYRVVLLPNGEWSEALNLGPEINTAYDEDAPFIHPDGKVLYFSSKGHRGMGGYDVFKVEINDENQWGEVKNLGYPINTTTNDIYFVISANGNTGYYSSAKNGGYGGQDIYTINYFEKSLKQSVVRATIPELIGTDIAASVSLIDLESGELVGLFTPRLRDASFIFLVDPNVEYELIIEVDGYEELIQEVSFTTIELVGEPKIEFTLKKEGL